MKQKNSFIKEQNLSPFNRYTIFILFFVLIIFLFLPETFAQSFMEDLFSGKLISSEPGVWAIYKITDKTTHTSLILRQAITGIEKIDEKTTGIWLESEIIPLEGFSSIFSMPVIACLNMRDV